MKKALIIVSIVSICLPLLLVIVFYADLHDSIKASRTNLATASMQNLGAASFSLTHASAVENTFNLDSTLSNKPIPTNQWWQNALVGDPWPQPLYNLPLSTSLTQSGLGIGLPTVTATADTILAPAVNDVVLRPNQTPIKVVVSGYDDASVELHAMSGDNQVVYSSRLVKGVPFVYSQFKVPVSIDVSGFDTHTVTRLADSRSMLDLRKGTKHYAVYTPAGANMQQSAATVTLNASNDIVVANLPDGLTKDQRTHYDSAAKAIITGTKVTYSVTNNTAKTTISYQTTGNAASVVAVLPTQQNGMSFTAANSLGSVMTVRGKATLVNARQITYNTPIPKSQFVLTKPTESSFYKQQTLESYLQADTKILSPEATSYDGSKQLYRLANLAMLAHQTNSPTAKQFDAQLKKSLTDWLTYTPGEKDNYFYYDSKLRGLVAVTPQYGSEDFNDHHFHYGYFLYAAAMMATYDKQFAAQYGAAVNMIADDISSNGDSQFPRLRTYDTYEGHSWAGGVSPFADGNNQESVSEAVNSWYALYNWAKVTDNKPLETKAQWLYANETAAATNYYYASPNNPLPAAYKHSIVTLLWGGKAEYATFFSPAAEAKHAIVMLPLSGGSTYLQTNGAIKNSITELNTELGTQPRNAYQDILLMGQALADPSSAQASFTTDLKLDDSNSKSYVYYYLAWAGEK